MIITIGREFGSGGHEIGEKLAKAYNIPLLDKNILDELAVKHGFDVTLLSKLDEKPRNYVITRKVKGLTNSLEDNIAELEFEHMREKAMRGESFVVVGRCAEAVLKDCKDLISIFILADMEDKKKRVLARQDKPIPKDEVEQFIKKKNKRRKNYHNYHCTGDWGDSRNYDLSINSSRLGIDGTVDMLKRYIDQYMEYTHSQSEEA